jgi:hypothetical protein
MSNRDALRKLSRIAPAPPEIDKIMDGLASFCLERPEDPAGLNVSELLSWLF